jgi:hypothetical protein
MTKKTPLDVQTQDGDAEKMSKLYDEVINLSNIRDKLEIDNFMLYICLGSAITLNIIQLIKTW